MTERAPRAHVCDGGRRHGESLAGYAGHALPRRPGMEKVR